MTISKKSLLLLAGFASMLSLAACGEDQNDAAQAPEPPARVETPQPSPGEDDRSEDAMRRITEGADSIMQGASELARDARERTERLLEDSGPALERAGEIAREIGASLNEITRQALRDFQSGVDLLERRIDESRNAERPITGDPAATLPPRDRLRADTRAAAQAGPAGVGPAYVGVWALDAAACSRIDVEAQEIMAVITTTTIRRHESVCNFAETPLSGSSATLDAACIVEGEMEDRQIALDMPDDDTLTIDGSPQLTRCHLPD